jgi:predicted RNase H-like HicB family nuclease
MKDYHINIFYSEPDSGYIADIPDLAYCSAFGKTPEDALAQVLIAKKAWVETAKAEGKPVPDPKYRPIIYQLSLAAGLSQVTEEKAKYK